MTNPTTPEDKIDGILVLGFLYGIESERLEQDEVDHRVAGFKHTQGFKEARHALLALLNEARIEEREEVQYLLAGPVLKNYKRIETLRAATPKEDV